MRYFAVIFILLLFVVIPVEAVNYYVSPTGKDDKDGLSLANAWLSIDNGDKTGVLNPGDTVFILPGTYLVDTSVVLSTSGTGGQPIVYTKFGKGKVIVDGQNMQEPVFLVQGDHTILKAVTATNSIKDGIIISGDSSVVTQCFITNVLKTGIKITGSYNLILKNIVYSVGKQGIKNDVTALYSRIYGNTVYSNGDVGIELKALVTTARVFNNIIANNSVGIDGDSENICGFNNVWGNFLGDYVGVVDSAGGISKQPKFVDAANERFDLKHTADEIDAGLDLGYPFNQAAPDIGAMEKYNVYFVSPTGDDSADGLSQSTAWISIDNGDSILYPGDTVYVLTGIYSDSVIITDNGLPDDMIVYAGIPDSSLVDGTGYARVVRIVADYVRWSGIDVSGSLYSNIYISGNNVTIKGCRIIFSGQYGINIASGLNNVILNNVFNDNITTATLVSADSTSIINNTFYDSGNFCIDANNSDYNFITNNIFCGKDSTHPAIRATGTTQLTYNLFYNHSELVQGGVVLGTGCFVADPLFLDANLGNFRLSSNSPAIDAGVDIGLPFNGSAPDLGAYETGILNSLSITPIYDTLIADSIYQFDVTAVDSFGYPAYSGQLTWSHTFSTGSIDAGGLFIPQLVGSGEIIVVSSINGISDTSTTLTVIPGSFNNLVITPLRDTISADSTRQFLATGFDINGNSVSNIGNLSWAVLNNIGTIDATGLFDAVSAGYGFIKVTSDLGPVSISDTISVIPGLITSIDVIPSENTIVQQTSFQYTANGYDADLNFVRSLTDSVTWSTTDPVGSITVGGLYTAGNQVSPPSYYVKAIYGGVMSDSGMVTVITNGLLSYIQIEKVDGTPIIDTSLSTDNDTTKLYCRGYDSGNNLLGDFSVSWSVIGVDSIGVLSTATGTFTNLIISNLGTGQVVAEYSPSIIDTTGIITCLAGEPAQLVISPDTVTISTDSSLQFTSTSLDADGNMTNPIVVVSWSIIGNIGTIGVDGQFTPNVSGTGYIVASGSGLADTSGLITVIPGILNYIIITPDSVIVSADSSKQFSVQGYDSKNNVCNPGVITWGLTNSIGTIDAAGLFDAVTVGKSQVTAVSNLGPVDTSSYLEIVAGKLAILTISPDSVELTTDSSITFSVAGVDADNNPASTGSLVWEVLGNIGDINSSGHFSPLIVGTGKVFVTSSIDGVADTNLIIIVNPGILYQLSITPDTATIIIGDSVIFNVNGYDAYFNATSSGVLTWDVVNGMGSIDTTGKFIAAASGIENIAVTSSINNVTDTSGAITIEALNISTIPLGNILVLPNQDSIPVLAFRIDNFFANPKNIESITLRDDFRGAGNQVELLTNVDSVFLFLDIDDDSILTAMDSLIVGAAFDMSVVSFTFPPLTIDSGSGNNFIVSVKANIFPHDGDTIDVFLLSSTDVKTLDGTTVIGSDTVNSFGYNIIDGIIAEQILVTPSGKTSISPVDSIYNIFTIDIPRNGYSEDTIIMISVANIGSATESDFDSLILYTDNGNGVWEGPSVETSLGKLTFTGDRWTRSGLMVPLVQQTTSFYLGVKLSDYPTNGTTLAFNIPIHGLEMYSQNDGPIDKAVESVDTIMIQTLESVTVRTIDFNARDLIPGNNSELILALEFVNSYASSMIIDSFHCSLLATDPDGATQGQLDSQIDSLILSINYDANYAIMGVNDTVISTAYVTNGSAVFSLNSFTITGNGGTVGFTVSAMLNINNCKNGNFVNLGILDSADIYLNQPAAFNGSFPLKNANDYTINIFPAAALSFNPVQGTTLFGGQTDQLIMDFILPGNGYSSDFLQAIRIVNVGGGSESEALDAVKLWADINNDGLSVEDILLGELKYNVNYWELTNLSYPIGSGGVRFYITVDVTEGQFSGGTLEFEIPIGGIEYWSGTIGPDDSSAGNPEAHLVFPSDNVTVISIPEASTIVVPGSFSNSLLTFALYNGYSGSIKQLKTITLTNKTVSQSNLSFADYELGQISLYFDSDKSATLNGDSLIAAGLFMNGKLQLSGLDVDLPAESLTYFFVVADVPLIMIDSDSLSISIENPYDFIFSEDVNLNGVLPLARNDYLVVDGSVYSQYELLSLDPRTLSPGDTSITLYAFKPAINGDQSDVLNSITIQNSESADTTDIVALELWLDLDSNETWESTDSLLGMFTYQNGDWYINSLALNINTIPPALFVTGDISNLATPNASFRAVIPVDGCDYVSGNDGPHDLPLSADNNFIISTSGLRITNTPIGNNYSLGQSIKVEFNVTNILLVNIDSVFGQIVGINDSTVVSFDSSTVSVMTLAPGQSGVFSFFYTAANPGTVSWQVRAIAPEISDSSAVIQTELANIQAPPVDVQVQLINSIPTAVTRGQTNVYPLSIKITHPDTVFSSASLRLDSLMLKVTDGSGTAQLADSVFSRMVLSAGYTNLTIIDTVPGESTITLLFNQPVILNAGEVKSLSFLVDIDSLSTASDFALAIQDIYSINFVDNNTGQSVSIDTGVIFPMSTASCRIDEPSRKMEVSYNPVLNQYVNYGQTDVEVIKLGLKHPGLSSSSLIQLTGLSLQFVDDLDTPIVMIGLFDRIKIMKQQTIMAEISSFTSGQTSLDVQLSLPLTLNPGESDTLTILVSVKELSGYSIFGLTISDSTAFIARDLSSGSLLEVGSDTSSLISGTVFPIQSGLATLKQPAESPDLCVSSVLPSSVLIGKDSLELIEISLNYPVDSTYSSVQMQNMLLKVLDTLGKPLDPDRLFDRIGYSPVVDSIVYQPFVQLQSGSVLFDFGVDGLKFAPGDSMAIRLVGDIEADVPFDHFVLLIESLNDITVKDATDTSHVPTLNLSVGCSSAFPFSTSATNILSPAGRPVIYTQTIPAQLAFPGQSNLVIFQGNLDYYSESLQGELEITGLNGSIEKRTPQGLLPVSGNDIFTKVDLLLDGQVVAVDSIFNNDSLILTLDSSYTFVNGDNRTVVLECALNDSAISGNYIITFDDSTFIDISDKNLTTKIYPVLSDKTYPLFSAEISLMIASLENSFTNYPNPFNPAQGEETIIGFVLDEDAYVDIEIFTITGKAVKQVAVNAFRAVGAHQSDTWSGVNDKSLKVIPGTYFCRITAHYVSGRVDSFRRKVAVVR